ncbi:MAG: DUF86 domain-containing protein [bacterium]
MVDDVILNKIANVERCLERINTEFSGLGNAELETNYTVQDSIILNLERASQATIDLSSHIIKTKNWGLPQSSREVFDLLEKEKVISPETSKNMKNMVGFRNPAVHDYTKLNISVIQSIVENNLADFTVFTTQILKYFEEV